MYIILFMEERKDKLIPSDDLGEFYKNKISTCLTIIYNFHHGLNNKGLVLRDINLELEEIFKMIKHRLIDNEFKELVEEYEGLQNKINKLSPFKWDYSKDSNTGERVKRVKGTNQYPIYKKIVQDKEILIWKSLGRLGLLGKVEKNGVTLR